MHFKGISETDSKFGSLDLTFVFKPMNDLRFLFCVFLNLTLESVKMDLFCDRNKSPGMRKRNFFLFPFIFIINSS